MKKTKIVPDANVESWRTGGLKNLTAKEISTILGFEPNIDDDPDKVVNSWGFRVGKIECAIWDYKGSHTFKSFSTFGPKLIFIQIFGAEHVE